MGGGGLLIFYVTNVAMLQMKKSPFSGPPKISDFGVSLGDLEGLAFCRILRHILSHFAADFPTQKPYLCTEFQSALKLQTSH